MHSRCGNGATQQGLLSRRGGDGGTQAQRRETRAWVIPLLVDGDARGAHHHGGSQLQQGHRRQPLRPHRPPQGAPPQGGARAPGRPREA
eukprot:1370570-Pleurochrysis_carterae.AAC.1